MPKHRLGSPIQLMNFAHRIAFRHSNTTFRLTTNVPVPLVQDYHRRVPYKAAGATYDGTTQTWSMLPGKDLRSILTVTPDWVENPDMLRRTILLRIINGLDQGSYFT